MKKFLSLFAFLTISGSTLFSQVLIVNITSQNITCNGYCNGMAVANVSGGTAPYSYAWNDSLYSTTTTITELCSGNYVVTVTDAALNTATASVTISQSTAIIATITPHNPTSGNSNDGYIETTVSGGTPPYTYSWNTNSTTANIYSLTTGTYTLTITDVNGCNFFYSVQLYYSSNSNCSAAFMYSTYFLSNIINFTGYQPYNNTPIQNFTWDFGDGTTGSSTSDSSIVHSFNSTGLYNVCLTLLTTDGCISTFCDSIFVNNNQTTCQSYFYSVLDSSNITSSSYHFEDYSIADSTSSIVSYLWNFGDGSSSTVSNPNHTFNNGTYSICLTIATSSGCSGSYCQTITVSNSGCQIYVNLITQNPTTVGGNNGYIESIVSGGNPPYTYAWNNGATTPNIYNLTSGIYTLNVSDMNGCASSFTAMLYEPYDTIGEPIVDTLITNVLDTCLNFIPDSFYISTVVFDSISNMVNVTWIFSGSGMTSSLTVSYVYNYYGNNAIVLSINCGTKTITSYLSYIHIYETTGILPISGIENDILVYPVPFKNNLNLTFYGHGKINITLLDATGRIALIESTFVANGAVNKEINTSNLPSGVYILNLENNGVLTHKQVIK